MRGVELDSDWRATRGLSFNLGAAFNDAVYSSYANATCPIELDDVANTPCNFTGRQFYGAPRASAFVEADYERPLSRQFVLHLFVNNDFRSEANLATTLSAYTVQRAYSITNAGVGIGDAQDKYEVSVIGKNILDTNYAINLGQYSSTSGVSDFYGQPRFVGLVFRAKL
jgi:iron complex outermembrane receptor protein